MKAKIEIFSPEELKNFFQNLNEFFDLSIKSFEELETSHDKKNLSIVFLENPKVVSEKTINKIHEDENFIFVAKDFSIFQKFSLNKKNSFTSPFSINKFIDIINGFINTTKHTFTNIELNNNLGTNIETNQTVDLTQAESHILLKLFKEKNVKKRTLERDVLQIKQDLNTSSMESHLNRIRKKLKKISSGFTISSKEKNVFMELINWDI